VKHFLYGFDSFVLDFSKKSLKKVEKERGRERERKDEVRASYD
jgi:hypothetical protein